MSGGGRKNPARCTSVPVAIGVGLSLVASACGVSTEASAPATPHRLSLEMTPFVVAAGEEAINRQYFPPDDARERASVQRARPFPA
jgi:hypothetical protein